MNKPIEVFVRHCNVSANSASKNRPEWFSREKCFLNLKETINKEIANLTVLFDGNVGEDHFLKDQLVCGCTQIQQLENGGNDAKSFSNLLDYVYFMNFHPETIIYILEDDYLHKPGWCEILGEVFSNIAVDYVTLYDHADKYFLPMYENLQSSIYVTPSVHWRATPSTTNTYACKSKTLTRDFDIHKQFCDMEKGYTQDHQKFLHLWNNNSNLISPIPGYSTHCETEYLSPVIDWSKL